TTTTAEVTIAVEDNVVQLPPILLGDAPTRLLRSDPNGWVDAWSDDGVAIQHTADASAAAPTYSDVTLNAIGWNSLPGGDIVLGDLGVSGQTSPTSFVAAEIDGTEGLRFQLVDEAVELRFGLNRFTADDDGTGFHESGRVLLLDASDAVVGEFDFTADGSGTQEVTVQSATAFTQAVFVAGAHNGSEFVFGAYSNADGSFGSDAFMSGGSLHGSEYILDFVEFSFAEPASFGLPNSEELIQLLGVSNPSLDFDQF
ncbi:MAG: hypothetical protein KDK06_14425, partial [Gammaproteobacteria bacterium]|nr:hypothetical protein [Gammaproteobacteria bacterium]